VAREQPAFGGTPPTVFTRWMLVTLPNEPSGPTDFAASKSSWINHLIRTQKQRRRDRQAEGHCGSRLMISSKFVGC
jgi:hypothetical protein